MTTREQDNGFNREFFPKEQPSLQDVIDWIKENLDPEDVFEEDQLKGWAESNGKIEWN